MSTDATNLAGPPMSPGEQIRNQEETIIDPTAQNTNARRQQAIRGAYNTQEAFNGNNSYGYKSNGRYVPWLVRRALKQLGGESRCRLEVVTSCSGIVEVLLSRRNLDSVPPEVFDFLSLETLRLDNNNLQLLDAHIGRLRNLRCLMLGKNQLSTLPASLANCRYVVELDMQCNRLSTVPSSIWRLKRLASLNLSWNQISSLPSDVARLKNLRFLDLEGNVLSDCGSDDNIHAPSCLPAEMILLEHLRVLNVGENGMTVLPPIICRLPSIRGLNVAGNKLTDLPPSFVRLEYLSELSLAGNQLACVPACLAELKSLRYLNLSRNLLRVLPASLAQLDRLQVLMAGGNNLIAISDCLSQNLQILDVSQNKLRNLCIGKLKNLTDLNVSHNRLEVLPMGIGVSKGSKRLVRLLAACNRISHVNAEEIISLNRLNHFDLSGNNIATISAELLRFMSKRLKEYCLQGNPIANNQNSMSAFPMCRHKGLKEGVKGHHEHLSKPATSTLQTTHTKNTTKGSVLSQSHQATPRKLDKVDIEAEVEVNSRHMIRECSDDSDVSVDVPPLPPKTNETTSYFPPPPASVMAANSNQAEYCTHFEEATTKIGLLQTVPTHVLATKDVPIQKFSELRSPNVTRELRRRAGALSPTEARLNDASTRILRVGSAGGAFRIDFSSKNQQPLRALSPSPASPQPSESYRSPHQVKVFVPPQALAHTTNLMVKFMHIDDVGLAELADEKIAAHVAAFSPVIFIKATPFLSTSVPAVVANRQANVPLPTKLHEEITLTLNLTPEAEAAIARRGYKAQVVDVLHVKKNILEPPNTPSRIVCSPHPHARMSTSGQQVFVKFGRLENGVAVVVSKSSQSRKVCRAAEHLITAELNRQAASSWSNPNIECTEF